MALILDFGMMCGVGSKPKIYFLELFSIACFKDAYVIDHLQLASDPSMECQFIRVMQD